MEIRRSIVLEANLDEVWACLRDPDALAEWLGGDLELAVVPGGRGRFVDGASGARGVLVDDVVEGAALRWTWWSEVDADEPPSTVDISLTSAGDGRVRVDVTERALTVEPATASAGGGGAWAHRLANLQRTLLHLAGVPA